MARRLIAEATVELERVRAPLRGRRFSELALLDALAAPTVTAAWEAILARPYPFARGIEELGELERRWPGERESVLDAAETALAHRIDLLGTGPTDLGTPIDWHRDWKTGRRWPLHYGRRMEYAELDKPSDVKVPWEISRVQWLLPVGQAYALTGDDRYAAGVRAVLEDWLRGNPYALGVNWAIAMEPALRVFSWTWLLHACGRSASWSDARFRSRLLRSLYLHVDFIDRNIERSDINGNHYTADAAALVVGGLVLGVERWENAGWAILEHELPLQVQPDGVDFEASSAYHRLVGELFALPALLRRAHGLAVGDGYVERVEAMGRFTQAYTGPDGLAPLWGDADDGRALPLGRQDVNDHGSLPVLAAQLANRREHGNAEAAWLVGPDAVLDAPATSASAQFPDSGAYVLRRSDNHVFIDCGPVGLAGRGGHGHNDCLSFEATLDGARLVRDCGSYVYTASPRERNRFRATAAHNTPQVDGVEQNRIPESLWQLENDAQPIVLDVDALRFRGSHTGYDRIGVRPIRTIELADGRLVVVDELEGEGEHLVEIPLHLAPGVDAIPAGDGAVDLTGGFRLTWSESRDWTFEIGEGWVSPSYGVRLPVVRLLWTRRGMLRPLRVEITPG